VPKLYPTPRKAILSISSLIQDLAPADASLPGPAVSQFNGVSSQPLGHADHQPTRVCLDVRARGGDPVSCRLEHCEALALLVSF
jgi:hypothetical protein